MSFKIPQTGIQRKLLDINLDDIQNHQNSHDFSLQLNSNMHQSKDEFENHVNQSYSEYNSAFWTSLRNIWKHPDREETNLITDKDDEHMDELKLSNLLSDINETTDYLMNKINSSEKIIGVNLNNNVIKTTSESVKQLVNEKNNIVDKQNYLNAFSEKIKKFPLSITQSLDRIFSKVNSIADEASKCDRLPTSSHDELKHAVVLLRNNFRSLKESSNRFEFRSRGNMYSNEISTLNKKQSTLGPNNYTFSSTGSTHSIHMKFRTPLSNAARKPNIRSVPRLTNDFREQKTYKEDYENHRTRKMRELQPKTGPNYYENMDCYVHSPGMTSDSSDCVSLSSILDM